MMKVISANQHDRWNEIVRSFKNWDIYYLNEYAVSFQMHGDGTPFLLYFESGESRMCYVVMQNDIAYAPYFKNKIEEGKYYDWETPYGYGGPLSDDTIPEDKQRTFMDELCGYCVKNGIVSQFLRFHPLLLNHESAPVLFETRYLRDTIFISTQSPEQIMADMDSKNRNMVRKAIKNDVTIVRKPISEYQDFIPMYEETMLKDEADEYYTFHEDYFRYQSTLSDHACFFYAMKDSQPIAGAIMYYNDRFMHYHLAGTHTEYRKYSPSNLLLYEASVWASQQGISKFHLGGGLSPDDNLFGFKKQFNKNGRLPFCVGRTIFMKDAYSSLLSIRQSSDPSFDPENGRMIQYRA
ncbi:MAG: GNAT family N-acetyltransferase [Clostridiales bacterium]|nr:GNAT family N-acetyltransferase [Clostridiales bacterium]